MYFAQIDQDNVVMNVIVADQDFINGLEGNWVQTDIDGVSPKNYAGIGYTWRTDLNGFVPPQPYASWILNETTCLWDPPIAKPSTGYWAWDESILNWREINA